jgi:hypothetical protein
VSGIFITFKVMCRSCDSSWFAFGVTKNEKNEKPSDSDPFVSSDVILCHDQSNAPPTTITKEESVPRLLGTIYSTNGSPADISRKNDVVGKCDVDVGVMTFTRKLDDTATNAKKLKITPTSEILLIWMQGSAFVGTPGSNYNEATSGVSPIILKPTYCSSINNPATFCADDKYERILVEKKETMTCTTAVCVKDVDAMKCCKLAVVKEGEVEAAEFQTTLGHGGTPLKLCSALSVIISMIVVLLL